MADFDPDAFIAQKSSNFNPEDYITAKMPKKFMAQADTTYSPEGIPLVTPSTQAEPTGAAGTAAKIMTDVTGAPVRAAMSVAKPVADIAKWMGYKEPINALKQIDIGIKEQGPELMGLKSPVSSIASFGGDIAGLGALGKIPGAIKEAPMIGAHLAPLVNKGTAVVKELPRWAQSTLGGAGVGVLGAEPDAASAVNEGLLGGVLGAAGHGLVSGAGKVMDPVLERFKQLRAAGLSKEQIMKDTTMGQLLGGMTQKVENLFSAVPFGGAATKVMAGKESLKNAENELARNLSKEAQDAAKIADINKAEAATGLTSAHKDVLDAAKQDLASKHGVWDQRLNDYINKTVQNLETKQGEYSAVPINRALSHIGEKVEPNLPGQQQVAKAQELIGNKYNEALSEIGDVNVNYKIKEKFDELLDENKRLLGGKDSENYFKFKEDIDSLFPAEGEAPILTAAEWHTRFKDLGEKANNYASSANASDREYGRALKSLKNEWMNLIEESSGSDKIKAANAAHSALQAPQRAASYIKSALEGGNFDPKQLLQAIGSESSKRRFAAGEADMQKEASEAYVRMMAERNKLKEHHENLKNQLNLRKEADKKAAKEENKIRGKNLASQKKYLDVETYMEKEAAKEAAKAKKEALDKAINAATKSEAQRYAENRFMYGLTGLGGLGAAGHYLNLPIEAQAGLAGGLWGLSNTLYSKPIQELIKRTAVAERPQAVHQLGKTLKENAPLGALTFTKQFENRQPQSAVEVLDPETGLPIPKAAQ